MREGRVLPVEEAVIVVTGAARGIGRACTEHFVNAGARVVAINRTWHGAEEFRAELDDTQRVLAVQADITDAAALGEICAEALHRFGTIDVIINNAALRQRNLFPPAGFATVLETADSQWEQMLAVNAIGTLKVVRAFIGPMLSKKRGSIISVGSRGDVMRPVEKGIWEGCHTNLRNQPYEASKAAMYSMSFYLAEELRPANIAVNLLFPGATRTTGSDEVAAAWRAEGFALGSPSLLRPGHVVPLADYLARRDASCGPTGMGFDAVRWNKTNGHGEPKDWLADTGS